VTRLLLDTHSFLWFISDHPNLSNSAKLLLEDASNQRLISIASIWEMAIKTSLGKLSFSLPFQTFIAQQIQINEFEILGITIEHLAEVSTLAMHHRDPFDRLLIAQALVEKIPIVSVDSAFDAYPGQRLW
jgi:PIN domain nuclease of toxin-antitoxin system